MLAPLLIMLREGLEASLIVVIIAAYLTRTGRRELLVPMWIGVGLSVALCLAAGIAINQAGSHLEQSKQELLEAAVGLVAVGVLTWMIFWMRKAGRSIKGELEHKIEAALERPGAAVSKALVAMAFFAVLREGLESALFLLAAFQNNSQLVAEGGWSSSPMVGAAIGTLLSVVLAFALYKGSVHLDLRKFFTYTGAVIIVFAAGLLARSFRSLHEAGLVDLLWDQAWDTSSIAGNNGPAGSVLRVLIGYQATPTILEVILYWAYLVPTALAFFLGGRTRSARAPVSLEPDDTRSKPVPSTV